MFTKMVIAVALLTSVIYPGVSPDPSKVFIASTPGDEPVKAVLSIPANTKVDFIRWNLVLKGTGTFDLNISFGEGKPNTLGFIGGGQQLSYQGDYTITQNIYHLKSKGFKGELLLTKVNDNVFHILTPDQQLMVGNGGWSYTLNAQNPVHHAAVLSSYKLSFTDTARQWVFDGRTPCTEFAKDHSITVDPACIKFKWRIILNRDPLTLQPTTYSARRIVYDVTDVSGKWSIKKTDSQAWIIQLNPDDPERSISLLQLDENILYFLGKDGQPYTGNADFSFVLNRKL